MVSKTCIKIKKYYGYTFTQTGSDPGTAIMNHTGGETKIFMRHLLVQNRKAGTTEIFISA